MVSQVGTKDMTDGNTKKIIINFAIPIFLNPILFANSTVSSTLVYLQ